MAIQPAYAEVCTVEKNTFGQMVNDTCPSGLECSNLQLCVLGKTCSGTCTLKSITPQKGASKNGDSCSVTSGRQGTCSSGFYCLRERGSEGICRPAVKDGDNCYLADASGDNNCPDSLTCGNPDGLLDMKPGDVCFKDGSANGTKPTPLPTLPPPPPPPCEKTVNGQCTQVATGFGALSTQPGPFIRSIFIVLLSIAGGIAVLLIMKAGYLMMTASGKPEQIQQGHEQLIAAIVGLLFLIFSFVILEVIGVDILRIPGLKGEGINTAATIPLGGSCDAAGNTPCERGSTCVSTGGRAGICQIYSANCDAAATNPCPQGFTCVSLSGRAGRCVLK